MYEGFDKINQLSNDIAHIIPGHDPEVMKRYNNLQNEVGQFIVEIK